MTTFDLKIKQHHYCKAPGGRLGSLGFQSVAWSAGLEADLLNKLEAACGAPRVLSPDSRPSIAFREWVGTGYYVLSHISHMEPPEEDPRPNNVYALNFLVRKEDFEEQTSCFPGLVSLIKHCARHSNRIVPEPSSPETELPSLELDFDAAGSATSTAIHPTYLEYTLSGLLTGSVDSPVHILLPEGVSGTDLICNVWPLLPLKGRMACSFLDGAGKMNHPAASSRLLFFDALNSESFGTTRSRIGRPVRVGPSICELPTGNSREYAKLAVELQAVNETELLDQLKEYFVDTGEVLKEGVIETWRNCRDAVREFEAEPAGEKLQSALHHLEGMPEGVQTRYLNQMLDCEWGPEIDVVDSGISLAALQLSPSWASRFVDKWANAAQTLLAEISNGERELTRVGQLWERIEELIGAGIRSDRLESSIRQFLNFLSGWVTDHRIPPEEVPIILRVMRVAENCGISAEKERLVAALFSRGDFDHIGTPSFREDIRSSLKSMDRLSKQLADVLLDRANHLAQGKSVEDPDWYWSVFSQAPRLAGKLDAATSRFLYAMKGNGCAASIRDRVARDLRAELLVNLRKEREPSLFTVCVEISQRASEGAGTPFTDNPLFLTFEAELLDFWKKGWPPGKRGTRGLDEEKTTLVSFMKGLMDVKSSSVHEILNVCEEGIPFIGVVQMQDLYVEAAHRLDKSARHSSRADYNEMVSVITSSLERGRSLCRNLAQLLTRTELLGYATHDNLLNLLRATVIREPQERGNVLDELDQRMVLWVGRDSSSLPRLLKVVKGMDETVRGRVADGICGAVLDQVCRGEGVGERLDEYVQVLDFLEEETHSGFKDVEAALTPFLVETGHDYIKARKLGHIGKPLDRHVESDLIKAWLEELQEYLSRENLRNEVRKAWGRILKVYTGRQLEEYIRDAWLFQQFLLAEGDIAQILDDVSKRKPRRKRLARKIFPTVEDNAGNAPGLVSVMASGLLLHFEVKTNVGQQPLDRDLRKVMSKANVRAARHRFRESAEDMVGYQKGFFLEYIQGGSTGTPIGDKTAIKHCCNVLDLCASYSPAKPERASCVRFLCIEALPLLLPKMKKVWGRFDKVVVLLGAVVRDCPELWFVSVLLRRAASPFKERIHLLLEQRAVEPGRPWMEWWDHALTEEVEKGEMHASAVLRQIARGTKGCVEPPTGSVKLEKLGGIIHNHLGTGDYYQQLYKAGGKREEWINKMLARNKGGIQRNHPNKDQTWNI